MEEEVRSKLKFILSLIRVSRIATDLGQFTIENIELIINQATQILQAFVGFKNTQQSVFLQNNWMKKFISRIESYGGDYDQEFELIIIEISNFLRLYMRVKLNLQIDYLLKKFYQEYSASKGHKSMEELEEDHQ